MATKVRPNLGVLFCCRAAGIGANCNAMNGWILKEWAATCAALGAGRQILLLRKGGIADGAFELEHSQFWLMPTYEHQHASLVKPESRDLIAIAEAQKQDGENAKFIVLRQWARVARVWQIAPEQEDRVRRAPHMWSEEYLQIRWNFRPQQPLLCVALRVYTLAQPHKLEWRENFGGCRSWISVPETSPREEATPALTDAEFQTQLYALEQVFG